MHGFEIRNPEYDRAVRANFAAQGLMALIGAELTSVAPGAVEIALPYRPELGQQSGILHAGIVAAIADVASGLAAQTLMNPDAEVLSVEFKLNLLAPAVGSRFVARGRVLRPGRTITACSCEVYSIETEEKLVATMLATMIAR